MIYEDLISHIRKIMSGRLSFIFFSVITSIIFYAPIRDLMILSFHENAYSHITLVPLVSGYFFYSKKKAIFLDIRHSFMHGGIVIIIGGLLYLIGINQGDGLNQNDYLSLMTFSALVFWIGGFIFFYGVQAFNAASFPLLYLIFMVPIPSLVLEKLILFLQAGSAEAANAIFRLTGVPALRDGYTFHLPTLSIEVAEQCSGIRSGIVLFISSIIAGHVFLRTGWKKVVFTLSIFPVAILKNGLRIAILTILGVYLDETFLTDSFLHKKGGIFFFVLAILFMIPILWALSRSERRGPESCSEKRDIEKNLKNQEHQEKH